MTTFQLPQVRAATLGAKLAVAAVIVLAVIVLWFAWLAARDRVKTADATIEAQAQTAQATSGITQDLGATQAEAARVEVTVHTDTAQLARQLEAQRHANPDLDRALSQPWPSQLRELARARRIARDRLGAAAPGSPAADPGAPAPGNGNAR